MSTEYLNLVEEVLTHGKRRQGPKPEGTLAMFGIQVRYRDIANRFPLITTRNMGKAWEKVIIPELLWIMSGSTNANDLHQYGSTLWDPWAEAAHQKLGYEKGELGPIYGRQLRNFAGRVDQLTQVVGMLKRDPQTRRAMISFWNLAGCVFVRDGEVLMTSAATSYNHSDCKTAIPIQFNELELKPGERMLFCDSLHAEGIPLISTSIFPLSADI